jgi:hypothetical protein
VQGQVPAEEARTRHHQVPGHRQLRAQRVPPAETSNERAGEQEDRSVRAERVDRTDPPLLT